MSVASSASATVVYDACVLFPAALRDLLMRLSLAGLCRARWTEEILDEAFGSLLDARPDLDPARLSVTRRRMCEAIPECLVVDYEDLIPSLELPDPDDRHVLAAAIRCGARAIITDNVRDFPERALAPHGLKAMRADKFLLELVEVAPDPVIAVVQRQAAALRNPPCSAEGLLAKLARQGLKRSTRQLRSLL